MTLVPSKIRTKERLCIKVHVPPLGYQLSSHSGEQWWWWCWGNEVTAVRWSFQHPSSIYNLPTGSFHIGSALISASPPGAQAHCCSRAPGRDAWRRSWCLRGMLVVSKRSGTALCLSGHQACGSSPASRPQAIRLFLQKALWSVTLFQYSTFYQFSNN